jgi:hypothetical protein
VLLERGGGGVGGGLPSPTRASTKPQNCMPTPRHNDRALNNENAAKVEG